MRDCPYTTGDPIPAEEKNPTLHVLGVPSKRRKAIKVENCKKLAKVGILNVQGLR
jgi:hypothetical protein